MAWETRKGKRYYYRSVRANGRVVKEYVSSSVATYAARLDDLDRQKAEHDRQLSRAYFARWDALDQVVSDALVEAASIVSLLLTEAGYHQHDRGSWRKKRMPMNVEVEMVEDAKQELAARRFVVPESRAERIVLVRDAMRTGKKGPDAGAAIACIRAYPEDMALGFWNTTDAVVEMAAGENVILQEILRQEAKQHKEALWGDNPTQMEKLLVDRIVACGLQVGYLEREYAGQLKKGMTLTQSDGMQKRIDRAHKRHLSAIKTLAQVRKLQIPNVAVALPGSTQVNIGEKQVNMAGPGAVQQNACI